MRWNAREDVIDGPGTIGFDAAAILMVPKATYPRAACIFLAGMSQGVASNIGTKVAGVQDVGPLSVPACAAMVLE